MNLLDLLFPKRCVGCKNIGSYICSACITTIRSIDYQLCPVCVKPAIGGITHPRCKTPWGLDGLFTAVHYDGVMRMAIKTMKYQYVSDLNASIVEIVVSRIPSTFPRFDYLVPVPLHPKRNRERGFNQSTLLANGLSKSLNTHVENKILIRTRYTTPQFSLDKIHRKANLSGAFALSTGTSVQGKTIALIDDIATTMATLSECAKVLKRNGAKNVWGIVVAHR